MSWKSARVSPHRNFLRGAGLLLLLWAPSLSAGPAGLEVRPVAGETVEAEPGRILTLAFRVTNRWHDRVPMREAVTLPESWRLVMPLVDFELEPAESVVRMVVVRAGGAAPAGEYEIVYAASGRADYALSDRAAARIMISPVYNLTLQPEDAPPERLAAGENLHLKIRLLNRGNADLAVALEAGMGTAGHAAVAPQAFALPAGESRLLEVTAAADARADRLTRSHLRLVARTGRTVSGRAVEATLTLPLEVVPRVAGQDTHLRYPVTFFTRLGGDNFGSAIQFGLEGDGYLDEARRRRLDFSIQAPDRHDRGTLGRRDEYRLRYEDPLLRLQGGDQSYSLSELTSWHRYGRGGGIEIGGGALAGGMYYVEDRWTLQKRRDVGAFLSADPAPGTTVRAHFLALAYDEWRLAPAAREDIWSFGAETRRLLSHHLKGEIGVSRTDRAGAASDAAWSLEVRSPSQWAARYHLSARQGGRDWGGRYPDSASYSGSLSLPLGERLRAGAAYDRYDRNRESDPARGSAPRETRYQAGLEARLPGRHHARVDYDRYERTEAAAEAFRFREHGVALTIGHSGGRFGYRAEARRGRSRDLASGRRYGGWNFDLQGTFSPRKDLFLAFSSSFGDDGSPGESRLLRRGRNHGGSVRWAPAGAFSAYLDYARNDATFPDEPLRERVESDQWGAGFTWKTRRGPAVEFAARRSGGLGREEYTSYSVTCNLPFKVPLRRRESVGSLAGRVFRSDLPGAPGVAGAVVYVGGTAALTDRAGRFTFRTLAPGAHEVRVDERSVGIENVLAAPGPVTVTVEGGRSAAVELPLGASGVLEGCVALAQAPGGAPRGLANILAELARPGETRRTVTDSSGRFLFEKLAPGTWTLKVYERNLPENHRLERAEQTVTIPPGARAGATVHVLPRPRAIRFIDEGRVGPAPGGEERVTHAR
ncbi:MAG: hypothetical protein GXY47_02430 [Acidobacteria bacterium]|nr:hypothetical protein [Acidobacteriota bacterium]